MAMMTSRLALATGARTTVHAVHGAVRSAGSGSRPAAHAGRRGRPFPGTAHLDLRTAVIRSIPFPNPTFRLMVLQIYSYTLPV